MKKKKMLIALLVTIIVLVLVQVFASRTMHFEVDVVVEKSIDDAWEVLGNQFTEAHLWSKNFKTSEPGGNPKLPELAYLHRATTTDKGVNWQELDTYNPTDYSLSYHVSKGVPPIAKSLKGEWSLTKMGDEQSRLKIHFIFESKGILGLVMSPIIAKKLENASKEIGEEFKYYVENGNPHPRKVADMKNPSK
jgi:hypothetical protein